MHSPIPDARGWYGGVQFPKVYQKDLDNAADAEHRKQFETFDDYKQELLREAHRWTGGAEVSGSARVKGVTRKRRKTGGVTVYEARCRPALDRTCNCG